jgi:hypothetical protein
MTSRHVVSVRWFKRMGAGVVCGRDLPVESEMSAQQLLVQ